MKIEEVTRVDVRLDGTSERTLNPGWCGVATAVVSFAALALVQAGGVTWWAKGEVAKNGRMPVSLVLHPLNWEGTSVQFLFQICCGIVEEASASIAPDDLRPPVPAELWFVTGQQRTFCTIASDPRSTFELFFLAGSDVSAGRTGVWRPHKRLRGRFPAQLEAALFGPRRGSYSSH